MLLTRTSPFSRKATTRNIEGITQDDLDRYYNGNENIQDVFPHLSADDREFIMTGITPEEWDDLFPEENE